MGKFGGVTCKKMLHAHPKENDREATKKISNSSVLGNQSADPAIKNNSTIDSVINESAVAVKSEDTDTKIIIIFSKKLLKRCMNNKV